jgi:hypothetical protein
MQIAAAWCVFFKRNVVLSALRYRALRHAYRAPSTFVSKMREAQHEVRTLFCDEDLTLNEFQSVRIHETADIFYLTTHGIFSAGGYRACLHATDWAPQATGIGGQQTVVAVFDTCFLIDSTANWSGIWAKATFGPALRLMLGFDNLAGLDRGNALRGRAFAENLLNGHTFVDAWFQAVKNTTPVYNKAIAIALGDNQADAVNILNTASLAAMPGPRSPGHPWFELRP